MTYKKPSNDESITSRKGTYFFPENLYVKENWGEKVPVAQRTLTVTENRICRWPRADAVSTRASNGQEAVKRNCQTEIQWHNRIFSMRRINELVKQL